MTVDMDWLPPAAPTRTANAANNTTTTTGRVDFFKNGRLVGGMRLLGWEGGGALFAGVCLARLGDSVEMVQRQVKILQNQPSSSNVMTNEDETDVFRISTEYAAGVTNSEVDRSCLIPPH